MASAGLFLILLVLLVLMIFLIMIVNGMDSSVRRIEAILDDIRNHMVQREGGLKIENQSPNREISRSLKEES